MLEFKFDTQLLIEGTDLDEDEIYDYFVEHFKGDCLLAVGDSDLIKFITTQTSLGLFWNTAPLWVKFTTLWLKIWNCRNRACTAN